MYKNNIKNSYFNLFVNKFSYLKHNMNSWNSIKKLILIIL